MANCYAVVIASSLEGMHRVPYSGTHTEIGAMIGRLVTRCVQAGLTRSTRWCQTRSRQADRSSRVSLRDPFSTSPSSPVLGSGPHLPVMNLGVPYERTMAASRRLLHFSSVSIRIGTMRRRTAKDDSAPRVANFCPNGIILSQPEQSCDERG